MSTASSFRRPVSRALLRGDWTSHSHRRPSYPSKRSPDAEPRPVARILAFLPFVLLALHPAGRSLGRSDFKALLPVSGASSSSSLPTGDDRLLPWASFPARTLVFRDVQWPTVTWKHLSAHPRPPVAVPSCLRLHEEVLSKAVNFSVLPVLTVAAAPRSRAHDDSEPRSIPSPDMPRGVPESESVRMESLNLHPRGVEEGVRTSRRVETIVGEATWAFTHLRCGYLPSAAPKRSRRGWRKRPLRCIGTMGFRTWGVRRGTGQNIVCFVKDRSEKQIGRAHV